MKKRVRKVANFLAFNLLFFALYLNFIHKDKPSMISDKSIQPETAAFSGTILVTNPEKYLDHSDVTPSVSQNTAITKRATY
ncbi:MAG TPA: hypothetical protein VK644_10235 [Chitinophagaceae bacterium]|nr:hypothetical protein [Chitinophagaceae bacterium]